MTSQGLMPASNAGLTVDAMEVLIKYCMNSFPQVDQFIRFQFLSTSCAFPIGQPVLKRNLIGSFKSNRKLINFLSFELINLRKGIGAIFYQHFHCIDSNSHRPGKLNNSKWPLSEIFRAMTIKTSIPRGHQAL